MKRFVFLVCLTILVFYGAKSQQVGQQLMTFDKYYHHDSGTVVYLKISAGTATVLDSLEVSFRSLECSDCPFSGSIPATDSSIFWKRADSEVILKLNHNHEGQWSGIQYKIGQKGYASDMYHTLRFESGSNFRKPNFIAIRQSDQLPLFHQYLTKDKSLKFETSDSNPAISAFFYSYSFPPALPPMTTTSNIPSDFKVDSSFVVWPDSLISFEKEGLYFFQSDTGSFEGEGILVKDRHFPDLVKAEDIIEPFKYILKKKEYAQLMKAEDKKKAFDQLVLDLAPSPDRARNLIRNYFFRVKIANVLYTTYKEGWKNDIGMVYIVFGTPDLKVEDSESVTWEYELSGERKLIFKFIKVKTLFADSLLVLERKKEYANDWFQAVELWRSARVN